MNRWLDGIKGKIKKERNTYFPVFFFFYSFVRTLQILHGLLEVFGIFLIFWMDMKFQTFAPNLITFWKMFGAKMAADKNIIAHCRSIYIRNSGVLYALSRVKSWSPPNWGWNFSLWCCRAFLQWLFFCTVAHYRY